MSATRSSATDRDHSAPWRSSTARMTAAAGDAEVSSAPASPIHGSSAADDAEMMPATRSSDRSRALDALAQLDGQDDGGGGGRCGGHLGPSIPYPWKLGGRRSGDDLGEEMVKVPYPDKEHRAAVHRGPDKENGGPRCQRPGRARPDHGHDVGGDIATIEHRCNKVGQVKKAHCLDSCRR